MLTPGGTLLMAQTTLTDGGRLSGTSALTLSNARLTLSNTGTLDLADRINNAAPVTFRAGAIQFNGRAQTASTEAIGALTGNAAKQSIPVSSN